MTGEGEQRGNRGEFFVPGVRGPKGKLSFWSYMWGLEFWCLLLGCGEGSLPSGR